MTPTDFRRIALSFPDVSEASHMAHPDFRVGGKIFATLGYPTNRCSVVMLSPQDQDLMVRDYPAIFAPVKGSWGAAGATTVLLRQARKRPVAIALEAAWRKRAPKRLTARFTGRMRRPSNRALDGAHNRSPTLERDVMPKMKAYASFDDYLRDQSSKNQTIIRALRRFVKSAEPQLVESVKWGNGCWLAGTEPVAYVYSDVACVQFGFLTGSSLMDPGGLLEGSGRYVRHIKVRRAGDIDRPAFRALLEQAASRRRPAPKRRTAAGKA